MPTCPSPTTLAMMPSLRKQFQGHDTLDRRSGGGVRMGHFIRKAATHWVGLHVALVVVCLVACGPGGPGSGAGGSAGGGAPAPSAQKKSLTIAYGRPIVHIGSFEGGVAEFREIAQAGLLAL